MAAQTQIVPEVGIVSIYRFLEQHDVRVIIKPDQTVWFVAIDVCRAMGIGNPSMALQRLDDDEKSISHLDGIHANAGSPVMYIISESGLYNLVLTSRKAEAKPFRDWVTKEVLPAIRQQGFYFAGGAMTRERVQLVKLARQLTLDVAKSKDGFAKLMLRSLLCEVSTALGQTLPHDPELAALQAQSEMAARQPSLPGV